MGCYESERILTMQSHPCTRRFRAHLELITVYALSANGEASIKCESKEKKLYRSCSGSLI
jgi:hypothetical protein